MSAPGPPSEPVAPSAPDAVRRVAVVGAGRMGGAMAARLGAAGFDVVAYNRTRAKAEAVAARCGAAVAGTAREAAAAADAVVVSLADDAAATAVYGGDDGLAAGLAPGAVVLETSTVAPETVAALGEQAAARGAVLLDVPVSGSVAFAEEGRLTVLAGGPAAGLERAAPVLDALAARVVHVGDRGAGAVAKLAVNSVVHALNQAVAEALVLAERAGVARPAAYEVFAASAAAAPFVHYKRDAFLDPDTASPAFTLDLVAKDLHLAVELAARVGAAMPQAHENLRLARAAGQAGFAGRDMSAVADWLRRA